MNFMCYVLSNSFFVRLNYGIYAILNIWLLYHFAYVTKTRDIIYCKAFGDNLRKIRNKKGFTMMELAFEAEIEYSQIAKIERGVSNTTISTAFVLAKALDVKTIELFRFELIS